MITWQRKLRSAQSSTLDATHPVNPLPEGAPKELIAIQNLLRLTMKWWVSLLSSVPEYRADPKVYVLKLLGEHFDVKVADAVQRQYSRTKRKNVSFYERSADITKQRAKMAAQYKHSEEDLVQLWEANI